MRISRRSAALPAFIAAALLLAGCSGSDDKPGAAEQEKDSPLTEYMNAVYGGDLSEEEQQQQFTEQLEEQEQLVAACMQDQGFEYTPDTSSSSFSTSDGTEWEPDDREWVSQYGYGAINYPSSEEPASPSEYVDPNGDYVATLSESEQTAFYEALYGPTPTEEEMSADVSYEYDWTTAGCQGAAQHEVAGEDLSQSEEFKPLFDAMNRLYEDMASSPEMAEVDAEWSACMEAAGHGGFATQADAQMSIYDAQNALYEDLSTSEGSSTSEDGSTSEDTAMAGEPDQAELDALGEQEVELALADLDCREETDYRDRAADITREIEQQFVDDHKTELDALKAAAERDGK